MHGDRPSNEELRRLYIDENFTLKQKRQSDAEVKAQPAKLLGPDFHPVEIDKKSLPLLGPAKRLPEEQQRKVARLLAIYAMRWEERYTARLIGQEVTW